MGVRLPPVRVHLDEEFLELVDDQQESVIRRFGGQASFGRSGDAVGHRAWQTRLFQRGVQVVARSGQHHSPPTASR
ncbi:hypothetical protein GTV15_19175 [Streptomyces sp. SID7803]|nr:hypothetical protein [Streptomyces sp. SID7803]